MSVRKRSWKTAKGETKEAWIVAYSDGEGERHIATFARKADAVAYESDVRVDVRRGSHVAPSRSPTVKEAADAWLRRAEAEGRERATLASYRQHATLHIVPRLGKYKLASLTHKAIEDFRKDLLEGENKLSRVMARKVLISFKSILKVAKFSHLADDVSIRRSKRERHRVEVGTDIPDPREVKRLIAAATPGRQKALLLIAATCGLRASELRGLRWRDVTFKDEVLNVNQRADRYATIGAPKSESGVREIPLAPQTLSELKAWKLACPKSDAGLVFPTRNGRVTHHANLARNLERLQRRAHVVDGEGKPKYGLHSLRHFFASWCLNRKPEGRELSPKEVQSLMGHSSIVITMDTYGHLFPRKSDRDELAQATRSLLG